MAMAKKVSIFPNVHMLSPEYQLTFIKARNPVLKVDKGRKFIDTIFPGLLSIVYLHEGNTCLLTVVINVFQFTQDLVVFIILLVICHTGK